MGRALFLMKCEHWAEFGRVSSPVLALCWQRRQAVETHRSSRQLDVFLFFVFLKQKTSLFFLEALETLVLGSIIHVCDANHSDLFTELIHSVDFSGAVTAYYDPIRYDTIQ